MTNCIKSNNSTQLVCCMVTKYCKYCSNVWLFYSICPSICGWYTVDNFSLTSIPFISVVQYMDVKNLSLLLIMLYGALWYCIIWLINRCPSYSALKFSLKSMKWKYFVNLSIIIIIELYKTLVVKSFDFNNLVIKSMVISSHEMSSNFITYILLYMLYVKYLFLWHYIHFAMYSVT